MHTPCRCRVATPARVLSGQTLHILLMCAAALHVGALAQEAAAGNTEATKAAAEAAPRKLDDVVASPNSFRISDVTLFDGDKVIESATVVVRGGWISRVCASGSPQCAAEDVPTIDGRGKFLMPSMIDAEGHFSRPTEGLDELLDRDLPVCGTGPENQGKMVRVSTFELMSAFAEKKLFMEVDTHGLRLGSGGLPHHLGERYPIPPSANYEKHIRFGVTTVLDMTAYPWPANYVRRSRNQWKGAKDAEAADLRREFLIYADFYGSGMWAAPAGLQFGFYGMDPVYNVKPDGPWDRSQLLAWIARRIAEGSDHIKVFYEKWNGADVPSISAATLKALVQVAHERGLKVFVHNSSEEASEDIARSGADVNIHAPGLTDWKRNVISDQFAERFVKSVRVIAPTMAGALQGCANPYAMSNRTTHALSSRAPEASFSKDYLETGDVLPYLNALDEIRIAGCHTQNDYERIFRNTAKFFDHGAILLTGTDAIGLEPLVEGLGVHYEAYLIREALDRYSLRAKGPEANLAALKAVTSNAALAYGLHTENSNKPKGDPRGFIKPGYRADLLLLRESPMTEILNTLKIDRVYKAGYLANRQMVRPECASGDCETRRVLRDLEAKKCNVSPAEPHTQ
jgi:imidazolonepropionase-like amidohydrolase